MPDRDPYRSMPPWVVITAAFVLAAFVSAELGLVSGACLFALSMLAWGGYRFYRAGNPPKPPGVRCLRCGQVLPVTARQCNACGSASWTPSA